MGTLLHGAPPIKIGGEWRPSGKGPHDDVEVRVAYSFLHAPTLARFLSGVAITAVWLTVEPGGWRATIKGGRGSKHVVAYLHGASFRDAVTICATSLDTGSLRWWEDSRPITP